MVGRLSPDVISLEIGKNDLSFTCPETVGSAIEDLVRLLSSKFSVRVIIIGVCHVIPRGISYLRKPRGATDLWSMIHVKNQCQKSML